MIYFQTEEKGFFGGYYYGIFAKTFDGGSNWSCATSNCVNDIGVGVKTIHFPSSNVGYAFANQLSNLNLLKTIDGGVTWDFQYVSDEPNDVFFINDNVGFIVCSSGSLYKTENGGSLNIKTSNINDFKIYPNPIKNNFYIEINDKLTDNFRFELQNILGKKIIGINLDSIENIVELTNCPKGVYIYKILNSENKTVKTGKIIKK